MGRHLRRQTAQPSLTSVQPALGRNVTRKAHPSHRLVARAYAATGASANQVYSSQPEATLSSGLFVNTLV